MLGEGRCGPPTPSPFHATRPWVFSFNRLCASELENRSQSVSRKCADLCNILLEKKVSVRKILEGDVRFWAFADANRPSAVLGALRNRTFRNVEVRGSRSAKRGGNPKAQFFGCPARLPGWTKPLRGESTPHGPTNYSARSRPRL